MKCIEAREQGQIQQQKRRVVSVKLEEAGGKRHLGLRCQKSHVPRQLLKHILLLRDDINGVMNLSLHESIMLSVRTLPPPPCCDWFI